MSAQLLTRTEGQTLVLTLSHPQRRNALHPDMYVAGVQALLDAERNTDIRSVLLTGADDHFCAGGMLQRLQSNRQQAPTVQADSIDALHRQAKNRKNLTGADEFWPAATPLPTRLPNFSTALGG